MKTLNESSMTVNPFENKTTGITILKGLSRREHDLLCLGAPNLVNSYDTSTRLVAISTAEIISLIDKGLVPFGYEKVHAVISE